jgi:hypothetical protein
LANPPTLIGNDQVGGLANKKTGIIYVGSNEQSGITALVGWQTHQPNQK